jgi:hypothetical protein
MDKPWQVHLDATKYTSSVIWKVFSNVNVFLKKRASKVFKGYTNVYWTNDTKYDKFTYVD